MTLTFGKSAATRLALVVLGAICIISASPDARNADNQIWFILDPLIVNPRIARVNETIELSIARSVYESCACPFHVYLDAGGVKVELKDIKRIPDDGPPPDEYRFTAVIPDGVAPGAYDLIAKKGANNDTEKRAMIIVDSAPAILKILHISNPAVGREATGKGAFIFDYLPDEVNANVKPDAVIVTGVIAHSYTAEEMSRFMHTVEQFDAPVYVSWSRPASVTPANPANYLFASSTVRDFGAASLLLLNGGNDSSGKPGDISATLKSELSRREADKLAIVVVSNSESPPKAKEIAKSRPSKAPALIVWGGLDRDVSDSAGKPPLNIIATPSFESSGKMRIIDIKNGAFAGSKIVTLPKNGKFQVPAE